MYLRTDEEAEAADSLAMVARLADEVITNIQMWRWLIIALHNAAQGFMVLSLRHGNGLAAFTKESAEAWLAAYESSAETYPTEKLDSYLCLYKKVKSAKCGTIGANCRFVPRDSQGYSIRTLHRIRNDFVHFTPKGWSLDVTGLPRICLDVLDLISFLAWETSNIRWHDIELRCNANRSHGRAFESLSRLDKTYRMTPTA